MKIIDVPKALSSLCPGSSWEYDFDTEELTWLSEDIVEPTKVEIELEIIRLQKIEDSIAYKSLRANEYPPIEDYIDGVVKNDQKQIDDYIEACLAVKAKYPKPSED
jgi:hypothetical protein